TSRQLTNFYSSAPDWRFWRWSRLAQLGLTAGLLVAASALGILLGIGKGRHSPRPLASVHAPWEANRGACHGTLEQEGDLRSGGSVAPVDPHGCQTCHEGPAHHTACRESEASCITCHKEHTGQRARLTRVDDAHCTRCHDDLTSAINYGASTR